MSTERVPVSGLLTIFAGAVVGMLLFHFMPDTAVTFHEGNVRRVVNGVVVVMEPETAARWDAMRAGR